ncbi:MAG: VanW family protein [Thermomicrobiales bacterium]
MSSLNPAQDTLDWQSSSPPASSKRPRSWQSYLSILAMVLPAVALLVVGLLAGQTPAEGDIERGVTVGDVKMDGSSWEDVKPELQASFDRYLESPIMLTVGQQSVDITPAELGISYDIDATHEKALGIGRGGLFASTGERIVAHTSGYEVAPVVRADEATFLSVIAPLAEEVVVPPTNATFYVDGNAIAVRESETGVGVDPSDALRALVRSAADGESRPIEVKTTVVQPDVDTAELQGILEETSLLTDSPLLMKDADNAWAYEQSDIVGFVTLDGDEIAIDRDAVAASLNALAPSINQLAQNADIIREEDGTFSISDGAIERELDIDASTDAIADAIMNGDSEVQLVVAESEPLMTKERLLPLYRELTEMVTRGVTLSWSEGAIALDKKAFSNSIYWNVNTGDIWFDHEALAAAIQPIADAATRPPTNLRWLNGEVVAGEGAKPGLRADVYETIPAVTEAASFGHEYAELAVVEDNYVTAEGLGIDIRHVLGSSTTYYGDSSGNRKTNIEVASRALNGTLIAPHSTFSFNDAIGGTASLEDGYMMGYGIVAKDGEILTVPSVAGGICQVATTTFQAAFWAGMPIETRSWHLYWIPRYGNGPGGLTGLDATVDPEYGLDFEFSNPTDTWLAVSAWADGTNLTIEVWGVNQGWNVQVDEPVITNVVEADQTIVRRTDSSLNPGQEVRVETAQDGFDASIHRVVKDAEGNVLSDTTFESYYLPAQNVILVGPS